MAKISLKKIEQMAGLSKADLHVHLIEGDPEELLSYVQEKTDLNVIAITDHDSIESALKVKQAWQGMGYRFDLIVGEEINSAEGHIVGLFLNKTIASNLPIEETIRQIHAQGGLAIAAHPFQSMSIRRPGVVLMDGIGFLTLLKFGRQLDGIEVVNATPTLKDENLQASLINKTVLLKAEIGSSDAHIPEAIGRGYTVFKGKNSQDLRKAIILCQTQAIYSGWNLFALIKYFFFFLPEALRIAAYNLTHPFVKKTKN
ncbi:phosphotransferase [Candidatus Shapirobacteria bacterium CG10_big_fil_rev_8_21_14_0_10_38_14]|uniref:Phosphotransferase n=1 Tax=Candidatus Shapirobacteria bacterium CG10_big_fil_rev_8_21_14_0_10_38_14 TaxID=1974483 RepID=A0A2M8L5Q5_9BACT|nr:MAG: phosphotransferase [Candidatus Shapirobacteria bacterium CG10_big_fil_rev_8_21_14_0_10_38_14]